MCTYRSLMKALRSTLFKDTRACLCRSTLFFIIGWLPITMGFFLISPCLVKRCICYIMKQWNQFTSLNITLFRWKHRFVRIWWIHSCEHKRSCSLKRLGVHGNFGLFLTPEKKRSLFTI